MFWFKRTGTRAQIWLAAPKQEGEALRFGTALTRAELVIVRIVWVRDLKPKSEKPDVGESLGLR